jgi:hypothetical protein
LLAQFGLHRPVPRHLGSSNAAIALNISKHLKLISC